MPEFFPFSKVRFNLEAKPFQHPYGMDTRFIFQTMARHRGNLVKILENTPEAGLESIPDGFRNNIWWNIGHILVVQQLLCYKLSSLPMYIGGGMAAAYSKGTFPAELPEPEHRAEVARLLVETVGNLERDYENRVFKEYHAYTTSAGFTLTCIDEALQFNLYHEGLHLGTILSLMKLNR
jgi:hypothetical protein